MSDFPLPRISDFVSRVAPFDALEPEELNWLVRAMDIAYFPVGEVVLKEGAEETPPLHIIHSGSVKLTTATASGKEILVDIRGEGEIFGALSLLKGQKNRLSVTTREDVLAFQLPVDAFKELVERRPELVYHFDLPLVNGASGMEGLGVETPNHMTGLQPLGSMAMEMRGLVSEIMSAMVVECKEEDSIRRVAQLMTERRVGSIVVRDAAGRLQGLVTDTDLRSRVLAAGLDPESPVSMVMSSPVRTLPRRARTIEAMLEMTRRRVHHLVVTDGDRISGIVSDHDISLGAGSSPVGLVRQVDRADSVNQVVRLSRRIYRVLHMLLRTGVSAGFIQDFITEFHDRIALKLLSMAVLEMEAEGLGGPPMEYAWLAAGGQGRREPTLPARQEYLLVYAAPKPNQEEAVGEWFNDLSSRMRKRLTRCGFNPSPLSLGRGESGGSLDLARLKAAFRNWIREPTPGLLAQVGEYFDFRPVYQDGDFAGSLWESIFQAIDRNRRFVRLLARTGFGQMPPLGFLREFVVERNGEYTDWLDLDLKGVRPAAGGARVLALDQKLSETNTAERLAGAARLGLIEESLAQGLAEALGSIALFRMARFLEAQAGDAAADDLVEPRSLNPAQRKAFKKSFAVIGEFQEWMMRRYGVGAAA